MPLGPLGVTAALAGLDWGAWSWATDSNHATVALVAGLVMAPIAVALTWSLARVLIAVARMAVRRLGNPGRGSRAVAFAAPPRGESRPFDIEAHGDRIAA
jgi:hypothetical protein